MMSYSDCLLAGAAVAEITPALGIQLAGDIGRLRPTEEIREPLYARALVLEANGRRCCLLALDLLAATNALAAELRRQVAERLGIAPEAVILHITQNHAAPSLGHFFDIDDNRTLYPAEYPWLRGGDDRYPPFCLAQCLVAVEAAAGRLQPVQLSVGRGIDGRPAHNRRFVKRDGTAVTHPPACDPQILYCEGPVDPEVGVLTLTGEEGELVSALLHFTCHPIAGYPHRYVIADWPGIWAELVRAQHGGTPLVVNGCCGNISPVDHLDPNGWQEVSNYRRMAGQLMETTAAALGRMEAIAAAPLDWRRTQLKLPLRRPDPQAFADARRLIEDHPQPKFLDPERTQVDWSWMFAVGALDMQVRLEHDPYFEYEIQAFRIGDFALVTLMGEPFVEAQLRIKGESPAPFTFVAHFCNGYAGYIPTAEACRRGGYESSRYQPDALQRIEDAALGLLRELFPAATPVS